MHELVAKSLAIGFAGEFSERCFDGAEELCHGCFGFHLEIFLAVVTHARIGRGTRVSNRVVIAIEDNEETTY